MNRSSPLPQTSSEVSHQKYTCPLPLVVLTIGLAIGQIAAGLCIGYVTHPESRQAISVVACLFLTTFIVAGIISVAFPPKEDVYLQTLPEKTPDY